MAGERAGAGKRAIAGAEAGALAEAGAGAGAGAGVGAGAGAGAGARAGARAGAGGSARPAPEESELFGGVWRKNDPVKKAQQKDDGYSDCEQFVEDMLEMSTLHLGLEIQQKRCQLKGAVRERQELEERREKPKPKERAKATRKQMQMQMQSGMSQNTSVLIRKFGQQVVVPREEFNQIEEERFAPKGECLNLTVSCL